jgi:hypothetical protein
VRSYEHNWYPCGGNLAYLSFSYPPKIKYKIKKSIFFFIKFITTVDQPYFFSYYMYKHNKDLFQNITGDNPEENPDEDLDE